MIKSAIFEPNVMNMSPRSILLLVSLLIIGYTSSAQYTEKINSNRPGTSQGAFSVGNNVLQFEGGFGLGKQRHDILNTKTNSFTMDYTARYGLLIEQLEIRLNGRFRSDVVKFRVGANEEKLNQTNFELNTIGAKYLIYDPYKKPKEKDSVDLEDLKSWRRTHRFKWKSLIPAVSAYAGVNLDTNDNPFLGPGQEGISPKLVIATQNNWNSRLSGDWVLVTNLIFDRITTDDMIIGWIITSTHTINDNWAVFGEFQGQKSDFYSDNLLRLGGAYLFNKDFQLDANIAFNFKDTPSVFNCSVGATYRFDWHNKDEIIEQPGLEKGIKEDQEGEEDVEGEEDKEGLELDELEEIENDSLKQGKTPFINDFEDDSFRDALEQDLDERRTAERLERERIEAEKLAKKEGKKQAKEDRRRQKREEKEARAAEKAKEKAEKEKAKMLEEIDAELDKMEQDDGTDDELQKLEDELKKLEQEENAVKSDEEKAKEAEQKKAEEDQKVDDEYEKLQKEQEQAKKAEEKAKKEEEKRRKKEEKKRQKEEKKRQKEEEKRKKQEDQDQENGDN